MLSKINNDDNIKSFMSIDWYEEDDKDANELSINTFCKDKESNTCLVRFTGFTPYVYIELPTVVNRMPYTWTKSRVKILYDYLTDTMGVNAPTGFIDEKRTPIMKFKLNGEKPVVRVFFPTKDAIRHCKNKFVNKDKTLKVIKIKGLGVISCNVWSDDVESIRQLLTVKKCKFSQWFNAKVTPVTGRNKISSLKHEYIAKWTDLDPIDYDICQTWRTYPTIMAYDIEAFSDNPKMFPVRTFAKHVCYMISCTFQKLGDRSTRKRYLILMGDCDDLPHAEIIRVADEYELLKAFTDLIHEHDPDILTGYNTFIFDDSYMNSRLERLCKTWDIKGSRLLNKAPYFRNMGWSSKQNRDNIIDLIYFPGRISIDMYKIIKSSRKFPKYTLNYVSEALLGDKKEDVGYKEMFKIYADQSQVMEDYERCIEQWVKLGKDEILDNELYISTCYNFKPIYHKNVPEELLKEIVRDYEKAKSSMSSVSSYCVQDSELVIDLFEQQLVWESMVAMSNTVEVTIFDTHVRGQQRRGYSMVFNETEKDGYYIDYIEPTDTSKFRGAYVGKPIPGLYENVATLDFNSLYPSIIIAYNICYSTYVDEDDDSIPDEWCNIIDINDDIEVEYTEIIMDENGLPKLDIDDVPIIKKVKKIEHIEKRYRFIKPEVEIDLLDEEGNVILDEDGNPKKVIKKLHEGFVPRIVRNLINKRKEVKKLMAKADKEGNLELEAIYNALQLALKVAANSMYGLLGIKKGRMPFRPAAESVTALGRYLIHVSNKYIEDNYKGLIVYGDTDSTMFILPGIDNGADCVRMAKKLEKEISAILPDPLYLEFEKAARMLCIAPKKYVMWKYEPYEFFDREQTKPNPNFGKLYPKDHKDAWLHKGILLARRDNCKLQRDIYSQVLDYIMDMKPMKTTLDYIIKVCLNFLNGNFNYSDLVVIKGLGSNYKDENFHMKVFADHLKEIGKPATPGERLEYLIVEDKKGGDKLGNKMRLPETFLERLGTDEEEPIDKYYYLHNTIKNSIDQLFGVGYKKELDAMSYPVMKEQYTVAINQLVQEGHQDKIMPFWYNNEGDVIKTIDELVNSDDPLLEGFPKYANKILNRCSYNRDMFRIKLLYEPVRQFCMAIKFNRMEDYLQYRQYQP